MQDLKMELVDVYKRNDSVDVLYALLGEREASESISHKRMPSYAEHLNFVAWKPYLAWYLIVVDDEPVGAVYLTMQREIGIGILKAHRGRHYACEAVSKLMQLHPGKFLANINPANQRSIDLFAKLGFTHLQNTYIHHE